MSDRSPSLAAKWAQALEEAQSNARRVGGERPVFPKDIDLGSVRLRFAVSTSGLPVVQMLNPSGDCIAGGIVDPLYVSDFLEAARWLLAVFDERPLPLRIDERASESGSK